MGTLAANAAAAQARVLDPLTSVDVLRASPEVPDLPIGQSVLYTAPHSARRPDGHYAQRWVVSAPARAGLPAVAPRVYEPSPLVPLSELPVRFSAAGDYEIRCERTWVWNVNWPTARRQAAPVLHAELVTHQRVRALATLANEHHAETPSTTYEQARLAFAVQDELATRAKAGGSPFEAAGVTAARHLTLEHMARADATHDASSELMLRATLTDAETGRGSPLFLVLARSAGQVKILDFTPGARRVEYAGASMFDAMQALISGNAYPRGLVMLTVPENRNRFLPGDTSFPTTGESTAGAIASQAGWAALGLGVAAGAATLLSGGLAIPVLLAAAGGAAAATSSGASLYDHLQDAELDGVAIGIDVLSLAGAALGAGPALRALGKASAGVQIAGRAGRFVVWSGVGTSAGAGLLIGVQGAKQLAALEDSPLPRSEKIHQMAVILANLALTGTLVALGVRSARGRAAAEAGRAEKQAARAARRAEEEALEAGRLPADQRVSRRTATPEDKLPFSQGERSTEPRVKSTKPDGSDYYDRLNALEKEDTLKRVALEARRDALAASLKRHPEGSPGWYHALEETRAEREVLFAQLHEADYLRYETKGPTPKVMTAPSSMPKAQGTALNAIHDLMLSDRALAKYVFQLETAVTARAQRLRIPVRDALEQELTEMEARHGFAPAIDLKDALTNSAFREVLARGALFRDHAFAPGQLISGSPAESINHGVQIHRVQWWTIMRAMDEQPAVFGGQRGGAMYRMMADPRLTSAQMAFDQDYWTTVFDGADGKAQAIYQQRNAFPGVGLW